MARKAQDPSTRLRDRVPPDASTRTNCKEVLLRAVEVLMLRYVAHQVMVHLQSSPAFGTARL
ncbi:hypothetical protein GQ600_25820 [Phytophthora cactorum]|nr:hypothetical protein GQ600_25820 [Phytophthora cactorum]